MTLGIGVLVILLSSAVATYRESATTKERQLRTRSGTIGAVLLSVISAAVVAYDVQFVAYSLTTVRNLERSGMKLTDGESGDGLFFAGFFNEQIYFGGDTGLSFKRVAAPEGDGYLVGRMTYRDEPAANIELELTLNNKYQAGNLKTDAQGLFELRIPAGTWYVNRLVATRWDDMPEAGNYLLVGGHEPRLTDAQFSRYQAIGDQGLAVVVTEQRPAVPMLEVAIRNNLQLIWPGPQDKAIPTTLDKAVVRWEPYEGAGEYFVQLAQVEHHERAVSYFPVAGKRVNGRTAYPISGFTTVRGDGKVREYRVEVFAFTDNGVFLSESESFKGSSFTLTGGQRVVGRLDLALLGGSVNADDLEQLYRNRKRLNAVVILIEENMLDAADRLLGQVEGPVPPGKRDSTTGYLRARQGRCKEANALFDKAISEGGAGCVPAAYRAGCPAPGAGS